MLRKWLQDRPYTVEFPTDKVFVIPGVCYGRFEDDHTVSISVVDSKSCLTTDDDKQAKVFIDSLARSYKPDPKQDLAWIHARLQEAGLPAVLHDKSVTFDYTGVLQGGTRHPLLRVDPEMPGWFHVKRDFDHQGGVKDAGKAVDFMKESWQMLVKYAADDAEARELKQRQTVAMSKIREELEHRFKCQNVIVGVRPYLHNDDLEQPYARVVLEGPLAALLALLSKQA